MEVEPIVILGMPRSGSSMTAGIFNLHGCWEGRCRKGDKTNPKGYHENLDVKDILIRRCGRLAQGTTPASPQDGLKNEILKLKPTNPWMVKFSAMYRRAFHEFSPKFVCVRRNVDGLLGSNRKTGFLGTSNEEKMRAIIAAHHKEMDASGGVEVYTDEVVGGNFASIINALEYCGLEPDVKKIKDFVEPKLWEAWKS